VNPSFQVPTFSWEKDREGELIAEEEEEEEEEDGEHDLLLRGRQPEAPQQERALPPGVVPPGVRAEPRGAGMQPAAHQRPGERRRYDVTRFESRHVAITARRETKL